MHCWEKEWDWECADFNSVNWNGLCQFKNRQLCFSKTTSVVQASSLDAPATHKINRWRNACIFWGDFKKVKIQAKLPCYRSGCGPERGRDIALLFQDLGARRGWVVSSTPRPHFTSGKYPAPIVQEAVWAPGPVWTGGKFCAHRNSIPRPSSP
jgi:hypothetical protein